MWIRAKPSPFPRGENFNALVIALWQKANTNGQRMVCWISNSVIPTLTPHMAAQHGLPFWEGGFVRLMSPRNVFRVTDLHRIDQVHNLSSVRADKNTCDHFIAAPYGRVRQCAIVKKQREMFAIPKYLHYDERGKGSNYNSKGY